jgi:WD40 repeat protein
MLAVSYEDSYILNAIQVYKSDLTGLAAGFSTNTITSQQSTWGFCWAPGHYILSLNKAGTQITDLFKSTLSICDPRQPKQMFQSVTINGGAADLGTATETIPMAVSPDGLTLAVGVATDDSTNGVLVGKIGVTGTQIHWQLYPLLQTGYYAVASVAWSPDGRYLAAVTDPSNEKQMLEVWDAMRQFQLLKPALDLTNVSGGLTTIAWSFNSNKYLLAAGGTSGKIYLWNIGVSAEPVRTLPGIAGHVTALSCSHDGQWLAASYDDNFESILVWKMSDLHG